MSEQPLFRFPSKPNVIRKVSQQDLAVQATNDDAAQSKQYAISIGYWLDPFISCFVNRPIKKTVEINRGYFARTQTVWAITQAFIEHFDGNCQIVNLGAGSDTLYWRLCQAKLKVKKFVEVDLLETVTRKRNTILSVPKLLSVLSVSSFDVSNAEPNSELSADPYFLMNLDLRQLDATLSGFNRIGLERNVPTLFLAECVLIYLTVEHSRQLLQGLSSAYTNAAFLNYEPVNMGDRFGHVMIENLRARSCDLPGAADCESVKQQIDRFVHCGWPLVNLWTMKEVYVSLPRFALNRIERIELLDEREVIDQLFEHYCFVLAKTNHNSFPSRSLPEFLSCVT